MAETAQAPAKKTRSKVATGAKPSQPAATTHKQTKPTASKSQTTSAAKRATQLQKEQQKQQAEAEEARKAGTVFYLIQTTESNILADIRKRNRALLDQEVDESDSDSLQTRSSRKRSRPTSSAAKSSTQEPDEDTDVVHDSEFSVEEQGVNEVGQETELDDDETALAAMLGEGEQDILDFNHSRKPIFVILIFSNGLNTDEPEEEASTVEDISMERNGVSHLSYLYTLQLYININLR
jgi:hypothetical protein